MLRVLMYWFALGMHCFQQDAILKSMKRREDCRKKALEEFQ